MPRDSQRSKLYRSEHNTWATGEPRKMPLDFETVKECQKFVNKVTRSKFWKSTGARAFIHVKPVPNRQYARGWRNRIELPPWAFSKVVILHELAHSLALAIDWENGTHGPDFVYLYRQLIEQELGIDERRRFDRVAEVNNVRWGLSAAMRRSLNS